MIRRQTNSNFFLIPQAEHARLAGMLAGHFGNDLFAPPLPHGPTVTATGLHDSGWPVNDDLPTLNAAGLPLHVFETPLPLALRAWQASADRAAGIDAYTGLLVSLHVLGLSAIPASRNHTHRELFELNKFQQYEIQRQETLRQRLGMATDIPLHYGVADPGTSAVEDQLTYNLRLLQAMDRISLALCCRNDGQAPPLLFERLDDLPTRPGSKPRSLKLSRDPDEALVIEPWPFDVPMITLEIPGKTLPAVSYATEADFRRQYAAANVGHLRVVLRSPWRRDQNREFNHG